MRTFDLYKHPSKGYKAVKRGFSWPAFLFSFVWAFIKRLWSVGIALVGVIAFLMIMESAFVQGSNDAGVLATQIIVLGMFAWLGIKGNEWIRSDLRKRGYEYDQTLKAETAKAAIADAAKRDPDGMPSNESRDEKSEAVISGAAKLPREEQMGYLSVDDFRVKGEKDILYITLGGLGVLFVFMLGISLGLILVIIIFSGIWVKIRQGQLLGQSIKVSASQFPDIYKIAKTAADRLCMSLPDIFITQNPVINAGA